MILFPPPSLLTTLLLLDSATPRNSIMAGMFRRGATIQSSLGAPPHVTFCTSPPGVEGRTDFNLFSPRARALCEAFTGLN